MSHCDYELLKNRRFQFKFDVGDSFETTANVEAIENFVVPVDTTTSEDHALLVSVPDCLVASKPSNSFTIGVHTLYYLTVDDAALPHASVDLIPGKYEGGEHV